MENNYSFIISAPKWQKIVMLALAIIGAVGCAVSAILFLLKVLSFSNYWGLLVVSGVLLIAGVLGIYVAKREKFALSDGVFTCVKPFKKSQSANVADVKRVVIKTSTQTAVADVIFYGQNDEKLINFYDDGSVINNQEFVSTLMSLNIPLLNR